MVEEDFPLQVVDDSQLSQVSPRTVSPTVITIPTVIEAPPTMRVKVGQ